MQDMPAIRAKIAKIVVDDNKLFLILDSQYIINENNQLEELRIEFGPITDDIAKNQNHPEKIEDLIAKIKEEPNGTFTLRNDLDASKLDVYTNTLIDIEFSGTLNGNGHSIKNLTKPLHYEKMKELARILTNNIPFLRVDFYEINNRLYFGELTFFPASGFEEFKPFKYEKLFGSYLKLPK